MTYDDIPWASERDVRLTVLDMFLVGETYTEVRDGQRHRLDPRTIIREVRAKPADTDSARTLIETIDRQVKQRADAIAAAAFTQRPKPDLRGFSTRLMDDPEWSGRWTMSVFRGGGTEPWWEPVREQVKQQVRTRALAADLLLLRFLAAEHRLFLWLWRTHPQFAEVLRRWPSFTRVNGLRYWP